jgi:hypothetical protein
VPERMAHLVGALPGDTPQDALELAYSTVGPHLRSVPDGETGERRKWVIAVFDMMRRHPDVAVAKDYGGTYDTTADDRHVDPAAGGGNWSDFDHIPRLKLKRPWRRPRPEFIDAGILSSFLAGYPAFREARERAGTPAQVFQIGAPGDFDMAVCCFGPEVVLAKRSFTDAIAREITDVRRRAGDDVVFQLEIPWQLYPVSAVPERLRPAVAGYFARGMARLVRRCPPGTRFGIHLCLGDMHHRSVVKLVDLEPVVLLANRIAEKWPARYPLEFMHLPFAAGEDPPPVEDAFYEPLRRLRLAGGTRVIAGFVHERRSLDEQAALLRRLDGLVGRPVDVSNSCGLGRLPYDDALYDLQQAAALVAGEGVPA